VLKKRQEDQKRDDVDISDVLLDIARSARDHSRVPMQWDSTANAGFTAGTPWMRVNDDYTEWNVDKQSSDPESPLSFYKRALAVRKAYPAFVRRLTLLWCFPLHGLRFMATSKMSPSAIRPSLRS